MRIVAFSRRLGEEEVIVVAPRLAGRLLGEAGVPLVPAEAWGDTAVALGSAPAPAAGVLDLMTGRRHASGEMLAIRTILDIFPVALLHRPACG